MGLLRKLRGLVPPSSRSFHTVARDMAITLQRIENFQVDRVGQLNERVRHLEEQMQRLEEEVRDTKVRAAHNRVYLEAIHRRDGESADEARRRMFASIPPASGFMRLYQLANARLMHELDMICSKLGIRYWFAYATLVGALTKQGFIPWDDDIDTCMMRDDIERLRAYLADDPDYQVTVMYDGYMYSKQVRFCTRDASIPCFIDLSIWDYARDASKEHDDALRQMRLDLMDELAGVGGYWAEWPCLYAPGSGSVTQIVDFDPDDQDAARTEPVVRRIEAIIDRYQTMARDQGILCDAEDAGALAYAIDNIYNAPWRRILWDADMIFPTRRAEFEQYSFPVPNKADEVAEECCPGYPFLPSDIFTHQHFQRKLLEDPQVVDALKRFAEQG